MHTRSASLSIIVPTLNEEGNIALLIERIARAMAPTTIPYDILFIDDFSDDNTVAVINSFKDKYPVAVEQKRGERGKAFSILQGVDSATGDVLCMIDADLQYPPESIPEMVRFITEENADVVVTRRVSNDTSALRKFVSASYNFVFTRALFGIDYDTQSGLKVFRRSVFDGLEMHPSPWSFDLEFIVQCLLRRYRIVSHDIDFAKRHSGPVKLSVVKASLEIMKATLSLRAKVSRRQVRAGFENNRAFVARIHGATS